MIMNKFKNSNKLKRNINYNQISKVIFRIQNLEIRLKVIQKYRMIKIKFSKNSQ